MKNYLYASIVLGILFFSSTVFAQDLEIEKAAVRQVMKNWTSAYKSLPQTRDINSILRYYTDDYEANRSSYRITNKLERKQVDYASLKKLLERIIKIEKLKTVYEIKNIYKTDIQGMMAYSVIEAEFALYDDGRLFSKGSEVQILIFRKEKNQWKISNANILNIVDEQLKGVCGCTIFASNEDEFMSRIQKPSGDKYEEMIDGFVFKNRKDGSQNISVNGESYRWLSNGEVWYAYEDVKNRIKLGKEKKKREVIMVILREHLYKYHCLKIRPNPKDKSK